MATGVVVGGVFLARDQLLWVVDSVLGTSANFVNHSGFEVDEGIRWDVFASTGLGEEGVEGIFSNTDRFVRWHLTIVVDAVFKAEQLPACVTDLNTGLTNVNIDYFSH